jgi:hypothetical protein
LDMHLVHALRELPISWIIPGFMLEDILTRVNLHQDKVIIPQPGKTLQFKELKLTPFDSLHFRGNHGVPEIGYLAEFNHKRWLFPGDIRGYESGIFPDFQCLDGMFAHLWLGKAGAQISPPPLLDEFCRFFSEIAARRMVVTHLNEYGRDENDLWDEQHFDLVSKTFLKVSPTTCLEMAQMGAKVAL